MPECGEIAIAAAMSHAATTIAPGPGTLQDLWRHAAAMSHAVTTIAPGPGTLQGLVEACSLIGQSAKREMRHLNICCAQQCFS
jgi:anthranilate/para-aminobenzoate synthase component II